jgi:hypothetical protein
MQSRSLSGVVSNPDHVRDLLCKWRLVVIRATATGSMAQVVLDATGQLHTLWGDRSLPMCCETSRLARGFEDHRLG